MFALFIIIQLHPFYNDFKVIESTEYHQGLKIEKSYKCQNNTDEVCSKIFCDICFLKLKDVLPLFLFKSCINFL